MDSEKRTEYRREVERRAAALRRMRKDRGIASGKPPCAYDKIQLRDYLASLRIEDEGERCAYLAALIDYWFTGVSPDHLDGVPAPISTQTPIASATPARTRGERPTCCGT